MNPWARALLGIVFGSAITLAVHPVSRQFLFGALNLSSPKSVAVLANIHPAVLPPPTNAVTAAFWLQMASEKVAAGQELSPKELSSLIQIGRQGQKIEGSNAFWPQMVSVFLSRANKQKEALEEWQRAGHCQTWNDLQTKRLLTDRTLLAEAGHWNQAWTYGYVYFERSDAPAQIIEDYAKKLVFGTTIEDPEGLKLRYSTICNGSLLRDGSRSIRVGARGVGVVEVATYPPSLSGVKGIKRLWVAQAKLMAALREGGLVDEARHADASFRENEAWLALTQRQSPEENLRSMCLAAIGLSALPGSLMLCALLGGVILGVVALSSRAFAIPSRFRVAIIAPLGVLSMVLAFGFTHLWPVALSVGCSVFFLLVTSNSPRTLELKEFGPFFSFSIFIIWLLSCLALSINFVSNSTAANVLLPHLGPTGDYLSDSPLFLGVAIMMSSLLFLMAPTWALVLRQHTPSVLVAAGRKFGNYLLVGSLVLCALAGPLSVYGDKRISAELEDVVANEPNYYLLR